MLVSIKNELIIYVLHSLDESENDYTEEVRPKPALLTYCIIPFTYSCRKLINNDRK